MFRPPAREICLNTLEDVYQTCKLPHFPLFLIVTVHLTNLVTDEESRPAAGKVLTRWRPEKMQSLSAQSSAETNGDGGAAPAAVAPA